MEQTREPISFTFTLVLGTGLARAHTEIATLTLQEKNYNNLKADTDEDIQCLEKSISTQSIMQTFQLRQCCKIGEEQTYRFYKEDYVLLCVRRVFLCQLFQSHQGIISSGQEKYTQTPEGTRKSQSWYHSLFDFSLWLTTLISTIMGPLVILLFLLNFRL